MKYSLLLASALAVALCAPASAAGLSVNAGSSVSGGAKSAGSSVSGNAGASGNVGLSGGSDTSASAGMQSSTSVSGTGLSAHSSFNQVIANVSTGGGAATVDLSAIGPKAHVYIVRLSKLHGYKANSSAKLSSNANVRALDAQIAANARLMAKLSAAGFSSNQVVAASASHKGDVTLFVNDKANTSS